MEIVTEELSTLVATMAIKDCKVADRDFWVQFKFLNALVRVFHALSLSDVTYNSRIKSLN